MSFGAKLDIIKNNTILVDEILDEYPELILVKAGHDRFKCVCPFHGDSDPSCVLYTDTDSFYCWGCHAYGDIVDWTRKIKKITIQEAMDFLISKYKLSTDYNDASLAIMSLEKALNGEPANDNDILTINYYVSNSCRKMANIVGSNSENLITIDKILSIFNKQLLTNDINGMLKIKKIIPDLMEKINKNKLKNIIDGCKQCTCCELRSQCNQVVVGHGGKKAKYMILGEAPGADEDKQGKPFVGKAGTLLRSTISEFGIDQKNIWIDNILHCRPPNNVFPNDKEVYIKCKRMWLDKVIKTIKPHKIMLLGKNAINGFKETCDDFSVGQLVGTSCDIKMGGENIKVYYNYHPSYICRSGGKNSIAYDKFKNVMSDFFDIKEIINSDE